MSLPELFSLDGKAGLVTGADSDLGRQFSEMLAEAGADVACADIDEKATQATATMGRIAEAAEIRGPALFLASAASDYMTGQILVTDGACMAK